MFIDYIGFLGTGGDEQILWCRSLSLWLVFKGDRVPSGTPFVVVLLPRPSKARLVPVGDRGWHECLHTLAWDGSNQKKPRTTNEGGSGSRSEVGVPYFLALESAAALASASASALAVAISPTRCRYALASVGFVPSITTT